MRELSELTKRLRDDELKKEEVINLAMQGQEILRNILKLVGHTDKLSKKKALTREVITKLINDICTHQPNVDAKELELVVRKTLRTSGYRLNGFQKLWNESMVN